MERKKWIIISCIFIILIVLICVVCKMSNNASKKQENNEINENESIEYVEEDEDLSETEIGIYSINFENQECEPSILVVPEGKKVNETYIVNEVIANFSGEVKVKDVKKDNRDIVVVFEKNSPPACDVSATMEELMLNCIAFSLIDNIENCENIIFRIEDEAYNGVNIATEYDEPYISSDISEDENE